MHKLNRMLDVNVMKIRYENSVQYQLSKKTIDVNTIYFNFRQEI
jgi:hypothetical protein